MTTDMSVDVRFVKPETLKRKLRGWERYKPPQVKLGQPPERPLPRRAYQAAEELIRRAHHQAAIIRY